LISVLGLNAGAVTIGQLDEFDVDVSGWRVSGGGMSVNGPAVVSTGGPDDPGDPYLRYATDSVNTGGRFLIINSAQWSGDYLSAGVTGLSAMARNEGDIELHMRLLLEGPGGAFLSPDATILPVGGDWQSVFFPLSEVIPTGGATNLSSTLSSVNQIRILHNPNASFPGPMVNAAMGIDNITAVPEPATGIWSLALLLGLLTMRRNRSYGA
jgi:hypothetical protein